MIERVLHPLEPVADAGSRVLLLGTMPSPKSREAGFYYAHPQNRFWRVLAALWGEETPAGTQERLAFARRHHIALWDVLRACSIEGADDGSIRQPEVNDLRQVLERAGTPTDRPGCWRPPCGRPGRRPVSGRWSR